MIKSTRSALPSIINVHEAKTHLSRLLGRAHAGEENVLAKSGKPYARLMPLAKVPAKRRPGTLQECIADEFLAPLLDAELDAWGDE